jgi:hypothetical protein
VRILTQVAQGEDQDTDQGRDQDLKPLGCFDDADLDWRHTCRLNFSKRGIWTTIKGKNDGFIWPGFEPRRSQQKRRHEPDGYHVDVEQKETRCQNEAVLDGVPQLTNLNKVWALKLWWTHREALVAEVVMSPPSWRPHSRSSGRREKDLKRQHGRTDRKNYTDMVTEWY